jgi:ATP-dependent Lon protease
VGGDVLRLEVVQVEGKGHLLRTGRLGEVMRESADLAFSFVRSHAAALGLDEQHVRTQDLHVHAPRGAQPKDGPSAGVALALAMCSRLHGRSIPSSVACTGELSLTGRVLAVGGLREKILAAQRLGMTTVFYPQANEAQVQDLGVDVKRGLDLVPVGHFFELVAILGEVFVPEPVPEPGVVDA